MAKIGALEFIDDVYEYTLNGSYDHWSYTYDGSGNEVSQSTPKPTNTGEKAYTMYAYDGQGNKISQQLPLGEKQTWAYDAYGNLIVHKSYGGTNASLPQSTASETTWDLYDTSNDGHGGRLLGEYRYDGDVTPTGTTIAAAEQTKYAEKTIYSYDDVAKPSAGDLGTGGILEVDDYSIVNNGVAETGWTKYTYDPITGEEATITTAEGTIGLIKGDVAIITICRC